MKYKISDIFVSIQGEGINTGLSCIFIRFNGPLNLKCNFCDESLVNPNVHLYSLENLIDTINRYKTPNVVLTGGEPIYKLMII